MTDRSTDHKLCPKPTSKDGRDDEPFILAMTAAKRNTIV